MPVITQKEYSHPLRYNAAQLTLQAHRKHERRTMPAAYAPRTATVAITNTSATLEIEYSVKETPGTDVPITSGVSVVFGRSTKKVLSACFEYTTLDGLLDQLNKLSASLRVRQNSVPQDSIKRNYQMVAEGLGLLTKHIEADLDMLNDTLNKNVQTVD